MKHRRLIMVLVISLAALGTSYAQGNSPLRALPIIELSDNLGHFDHMSADVQGKRLFMSDEDSNTTEVVSLETGERLHTILGLKVPHNSRFIPEINTLLLTDSGGSMRFYDGTTYQLKREVKLLRNCDFMVYDPATKLVYVTNGGHSVPGMDHAFLSLLDTRTGERKGDILLKAAHIEAIAGEKNGPRIFVDASDRGSILVVDRNQKKVIAEWKIPNAGAPEAIALDEKNKRLFIGCREPARMVVLDTDTGKGVADLPISESTDDMSFDEARNRIYVSGEDYIAVIQENDPDHYTGIGQVPTGKGGKTSTFVPELSRFYVAQRPAEGNPRLQIFEAQ